MAATVATLRHELRCAQRDRLPQLMLIVFLVMAAAAAFIGWLTHFTVTAVYNEAVRQGVTQQPDPFLGVPGLYPMKNTVIYIAAVGALLAILVGVQSGLRERRTGVVDLVLTRPVSLRLHVMTKLAGVCVWLGVVLTVTAVLTGIGLSLTLGRLPSAGDVASLLLFFSLSWFFLVPWASLGMMSGLRGRRETTALLLPVLTWVLFLFVLPQLGTAEEPVSFLNPVAAQAPSQGAFFQVNSKLLQPVSLVTHYKELGAATLHFGPDPEAVLQAAELALMVCVAVAPLVVFAPRLLRKGELYE